MLQIVTSVRYTPGLLTVDIIPAYDLATRTFVEKLHDGPARVHLAKWYRGRSTGWKSQSHHLWGHAEQIGNHLGYAKSEMMMIIADMTPTWPRVDYKGRTISASESVIDVYTASQAIDVAHRIAAEENISLIEEEF